MKIKYLDLFSGIGGFRYSLMQVCKKFKINCTSIGFSEIDKNAIKTYIANFPMDSGEINFGDIAEITGIESDKKSLTEYDYKRSDRRINDLVPDFDFLFAGFPCQSFSIMGNGAGFADTRGTLFFHIERILSAKRPRFFLLENVRGLLNHNGGSTYDAIIKILEKKHGYHTTTWLLNSSDYGAPQTRRRLFILGFSEEELKNKVKKPSEIDLRRTKNPTTWHLLERKVDEKYYLSRRILKTVLANGSGGFSSKSEINPLIARPLCATMHKMHRACQDNYFSDRFIQGKYDKENNKVILNKKVKNNIRRITPKEAFRFHGFPDSFVIKARNAEVSDTQLYRQAGNAVTVNVVKKVLTNVIREIK